MWGKEANIIVFQMKLHFPRYLAFIMQTYYNTTSEVQRTVKPASYPIRVSRTDRKERPEVAHDVHF